MPTLFLASTEDPAGMKIIGKIAEKYSFKDAKTKYGSYKVL